MDDLFERIRQAAPDPPVLTDDELARLEAWVKVHGRQLPYTQRYNAWKANRAKIATPEIEREAAWRRHLYVVLEYNRNLRKGTLAVAGGSSTTEAVSQSDRPDEHGYVASPADPTAYVPMTDIRTKHTPASLAISMDRLVAIIEDHNANRVRWTRPLTKKGRPMQNRRSVHLGDWAAYVKRHLPVEEDGFPQLTEAEIEDIERRKAAAHRLKRTNK